MQEVKTSSTIDIQKQKLGFGSIVLMGINGIIGTGIFLLPSSGMKLFGPASILSLLLDGALIFCIGLCFAECSSLFRKNGGPYLYARSAFGNFVGYEVGFMTWVVRMIAEATLYVGFATALAGMFPSLNNPLAKNVLVTILGLVLMSLNLAGARLTAFLNNVVTVGKLIPMILVGLLGLFFLHPANFTPFFVPGKATMSSFGQTTMTLFYVFTGFEGLVVAAGEMKNPKKNLPKALIMAMGAVVTIYLLIMIACIGVLGSGLVNSTVPLQDAMSKMVGSWGGALVAAGTLLSIGGICVSSSFITPRSGQALAEHKMMPAVLAKKNRFGAPYVAIIISTLVGLLLAYSGTFAKLAMISAISRFVQYIPTCLAVLVFRRTMKDKERTFKVPFGPVIPVIAIVVSLWLLSNTPSANLLWGFGALLIAIPFYFITGRHADNDFGE
ncbi:APC family permease [Limosilactobacillus secaliphilus]|uniref:Amino acid permease n=1 Tax=Limosilactobacillus secaliphilus TaxID=396268 RepID=A0A0R2HZE3_9LACO|nr:APC family permease [Limosilactobacillus secaliphilus]KRN58224.1 hypothetical protein IV45_GL000669 [Limosilactobacillus secaliphilus]